MRNYYVLFAILILILGVMACQGLSSATPTPYPTHTPFPTYTPLPTYTPIPTATLTPSLTPTLTLNVDSMQVSEIDGMILVYVSAGEFEMGSSADKGLAACQELYEPFGNVECERSWYEDGEPIHNVYLDAYYIDQREVTNTQYKKCVEDGACDLPWDTSSYTHVEYYRNSQFDNYPVIYVSWYDAQAYCEWAGRRLPTEAEWEKAAGGENGLFYPWGNTFDGEMVNFCDSNCAEFNWASWANPNYNDGYADIAPVGSYPTAASQYGVLDMAGNVWEWVADWYDEEYYNNSPFENPKGPSSGEAHVLRGGSWREVGDFVRTALRYTGYFEYSDNSIGFRCARSP